MATTTTPVSEIRKIHPFRRTVGFLLIVVLLAILGVLGWFYSVARSALPELEVTIIVPGLFAPVRVIRDIHGVPTIEAESLSDLYFTQGYVIAQDRLWQMDGMRRFAAGELANRRIPSICQRRSCAITYPCVKYKSLKLSASMVGTP